MWHNTPKRESIKLGFVPGNTDPTVFFRYKNDRSIQIAGWYVDDGLLAADSTKSMDKMVNDIRGSFDIQDLGDPERLLGVKIIRDRERGFIHISQPSFINTIAKRFGIPPGKGVTTPMEPQINLLTAAQDDVETNIPHSSLIGSLNFCAIFTRPDIAYATNKCAQFLSNRPLIIGMLPSESFAISCTCANTESNTHPLVLGLLHTHITLQDSPMLTLPVISMTENPLLAGFSHITMHPYHGLQRNRVSLLIQPWRPNW